MKLKVITPDVTLFEGNIKSINIAERGGSFTILKGHAPLIVVVRDPVSTIQTETDELTYIAAKFGTLKVLDNEVSLIVDYGVDGTSKEDARTNLENLRNEIIQNSDNLGDDTIANLEIELLKRMQKLGRH